MAEAEVSLMAECSHKYRNQKTIKILPKANKTNF